MRLVIVGGGPAALATARAYREAGGDGDVDDPHARADRSRTAARRSPRSSCAASWTTRSCRSRPPEWYAEHGVDVRLGAEADTLDPAARRSLLGSGETLRYDACVLATGAEPTRAPGPGATEEWVLLLRSLADARVLRARAENGRERDRDRLGLHRLRGRRLAGACAGSKVTLVTDEAIPHAARLGEEAGAADRRLARAGLGVELLLGEPVEASSGPVSSGRRAPRRT